MNGKSDEDAKSDDNDYDKDNEHADFIHDDKIETFVEYLKELLVETSEPKRIADNFPIVVPLKFVLAVCNKQKPAVDSFFILGKIQLRFHSN